MTAYPPDSRVEVRPFDHRRDGDTVTIGDLERHVFLAIPPEGFDILQALARGETVGEAARRYKERHGQPVDVDAFLGALAAEGFVAPPAGTEQGNGHAQRRFVGHLSWISPATARRLLSKPVLATCGLLVAAALVLVAIDPAAVPGFGSLAYADNLALLTWLTFFIAISGTMLHEVAHVLGARAAGVPARIRLSHRLYVPVIETDMTGIWLAPKRARYLGFLAGPILDAASVSVLFGVLWAERRGWLSLSPDGLLLLRGVVASYFGRILWQTFVFLRTDFYYPIATSLNCKSLMTDTENYLENLIARLRRRRPRYDQSGIPRREMWAIRLFAVLWLGGRAISITLLFTVTIPLLWFYLGTCYDYLTNPATELNLLDFLTAVLLSITLTMLGIVLWLRALYKGGRRRWQAYRKARMATA